MLIERAVPAGPLPGGLRWAVGLPLVIIATLLAVWAARTMRRAGTNISPYEPATALVVDGPYCFTRNPLYLSLAILYVGTAALANTPWPLVLLPVVLVVIQRGVIDREERYLELKFGDAYRRYKEAVKRWI